MKQITYLMSAFLLIASACSSERLQPQNTDYAGVALNSRKTEAVTSNFDERSDYYTGCWIGMRGGYLEITGSEISDNVSSKSFEYREVSNRRTSDGKEVLLEISGILTSTQFLNKFVMIYFKSDGLKSIATYKTFDDYKSDKYASFGFFDLKNCFEK